MSRYEVRLSNDALQDLQDIYAYIAVHDAVAKADRVLDRVLELVDSLESDPGRGGHPRELMALGHDECRQVLLGPYRVVYWVDRRSVQILLVADGRRDMRSLLTQRLLGA